MQSSDKIGVRREWWMLLAGRIEVRWIEDQLSLQLPLGEKPMGGRGEWSPEIAGSEGLQTRAYRRATEASGNYAVARKGVWW